MPKWYKYIKWYKAYDVEYEDLVGYNFLVVKVVFCIIGILRVEPVNKHSIYKVGE